MSLDLTATVAARGVDIALSLQAGQCIAILGPNGAGKSTVLQVLAGIVRPDAGRATLDGSVLFDVDHRPATWRPPHDRGTALLAQDALLFPHLTALDNVAFGPRSSGVSRRASRSQAREWLDRVDAADLAARTPGQLSGGQAQRVAVARALATEPRLLLLDEPMAALDITVVPAMRQVLRRVLAGRSAVIVTHDVLDALLLADRVIVMDGGRIVEDGPTKTVLTRPRSTFGAGIAGLNLIRGVWRDGRVVTPAGHAITGLCDEPLADGAAAVAVFDPAAVAVFLERPSGSPRNTFASTVREVEPRGAQARIRTDNLSADVTIASVAELDLVPGTAVQLVIKASEVAVYPA